MAFSKLRALGLNRFVCRRLRSSVRGHRGCSAEHRTGYTPDHRDQFCSHVNFDPSARPPKNQHSRVRIQNCKCQMDRDRNCFWDVRGTRRDLPKSSLLITKTKACGRRQTINNNCRRRGEKRRRWRIRPMRRPHSSTGSVFG